MNLLLGNAALLPWLLLALVPLLLHLFARSRPPAYRFSSTALIAHLKREATRIKRPRDWLLLLLRTAVFLLLAGVFLLPVLFRHGRPAGAFERRQLVVLVDATASMAYADGSQSRFAAACAEASEALAGLSARDRAGVVWLRQTPESVLPELSGNTEFLRDALRQARVTAGGGDPARALALALTLLAEAEGRREICIVSDFQKTNWEGFRPTLPPGVGLWVIPVGVAPGENGAITRVTSEPARPILGEETTVFCEVANFSPRPQRRTVFLEAGDARLSAPVLVPAWGYAVAALACRFPAPGVMPVVASLDEDVFPSDNRRQVTVPVDAHVRVGLLADDAGVATAWKRAIVALGWAQIEPVTAAELEGGREWDALLLAGWDGAAADAIARRSADGTLVAVYPHRTLTPASLWKLAGLTPPLAPGVWRWEEPPALMPVRLVRGDHPLFAFFLSAGIADPVRGGFRARYRMDGDSLPPMEALLAYADGVPALARRPDRPLYLWNMPLAPTLSDWPKQAEFVLFMGEWLQAHRSARPVSIRAETYPGETLMLVPDQALAAGALTLRGDDGAPLVIAERFHEGRQTWVTGPVELPGLYTWRQGDDVLRRDAVNMPVVESDLRALDPARWADAGAVSAEGGAQLKALHEGLALWPWLLGLCLGLAVLESLAAWWVEWS